MEPRSILPAVWDVPAEFRQRLGTQAGRQRAMLAQGHLLLVLHKPPAPDEVQRQGRFFWRKPDGSWSSDDLGAGPHALQRHLAEYTERLAKLDQLEETARTAEQYFAVLDGVTPLHRAARNLHQTLQQAREAVPDDRDLINGRDRAYEIERTAELLCQDARNGLDFAIARRAEEQAASSRSMAVAAHRLNLLAAFFFPIATLSAIFGMNLHHGFEGLDTHYGPWPLVGVLAVGMVTGVVLKGLVNGSPRK